MLVYTTTDLTRDDLGTSRAVRQAIADGTLSRTETVRENETVVYAVNATGLTGLPAARNATVETGSDLAELDGLAFDVRSSGSTLATGTESVPSNSTVALHDGGLFVVSNGSDAFATDETPTDGEAFTAEFRVEDERLRAAASDAESDHEASATITFDGSESSGDDSGTSDGGNSLGDSGGGGAGDGATGGSGVGGADRSTDGDSDASTTGDASSAGSAAEGARGRNDDRVGPGFGRMGARGEIRPVADVRGVAGDEPVVTPAGAPTQSGRPPASGDRSESDAESARDGPPSGAPETDGSTADETGPASASGGTNASGSTEGSETRGDGTDAGPPTPSYDDAPIRATAEDVPGFGPLATVIALVLVGRLGARRRES
ncbi:PGF-CTERM sorting domain-containing protein [Halorubrum sp. HHNYT27]|uniref:PGF-CTERM sorting domain-containing protein n=1 Tax=Halorubrum sp. HHNYT27 TaxID=3402275 RepID=UPI003EBA2808